jgi:hypothetical protein
MLILTLKVSFVLASFFELKFLVKVSFVFVFLNTFIETTDFTDLH